MTGPPGRDGRDNRTRPRGPRNELGPRGSPRAIAGPQSSAEPAVPIAPSRPGRRFSGLCHRGQSPPGGRQPRRLPPPRLGPRRPTPRPRRQAHDRSQGAAETSAPSDRRRGPTGALATPIGMPGPTNFPRLRAPRRSPPGATPRSLRRRVTRRPFPREPPSTERRKLPDARRPDDGEHTTAVEDLGGECCHLVDADRGDPGELLV